MSTFSIFLVLITIVALLLIVVIMIQNPKGGGLDSSLGGSSIGGVQSTNKFLDNSTWTLAILLLGLILLSGISFSGGNNGASKVLDPNTTTPVNTTTTTPKAEPQKTTETEKTTELPVKQ